MIAFFMILSSGQKLWAFEVDLFFFFESFSAQMGANIELRIFCKALFRKFCFNSKTIILISNFFSNLVCRELKKNMKTSNTMLTTN